MAPRSCAHEHPGGKPCRAAPLTDGRYCRMHDPEQADEVAEARRLGGLRRKRERTVAAVYDLDGLDSVAAIRRAVEIALLDTLSLDNSVARNRVLIAASLVAARLLEADRVERMAWNADD